MNLSGKKRSALERKNQETGQSKLSVCIVHRRSNKILQFDSIYKYYTGKKKTRSNIIRR